MSGAISLGTMAAYAATAVGGAMLAKSMSKPATMPAPQAPEPPPQIAKTAGSVIKRTANAASGGVPAAAAATMLTGGAAGVDPGGLLLGKNTLLGQ